MNNKKQNKIDTGPYFFTDKNIFGQSLIHLINLYLPKNSTIVELGTGFGTTASMFAQNCPNIKKIYTVDPYLPYTTSWVEDGIPFGEKEIDNAKIIAKHNFDFSGFKEKIELELLEKEMPELQKEKAELEIKMNDGNLGFEELQKAAERIGIIVQLLDEKEMRWLELSEKQG
jgi:hypothetical protein